MSSREIKWNEPNVHVAHHFIPLITCSRMSNRKRGKSFFPQSPMLLIFLKYDWYNKGIKFWYFWSFPCYIHTLTSCILFSKSDKSWGFLPPPPPPTPKLRKISFWNTSHHYLSSFFSILTAVLPSPLCCPSLTVSPCFRSAQKNKRRRQTWT